MEFVMKYNLSEIMSNAWKYRGDGLTQSEALKQAWNPIEMLEKEINNDEMHIVDVRKNKKILVSLKKEIEEQLKIVQYQINNIENPIPESQTFKIDEYIRDNIKVWGAIITGIDKKYGFKRKFKSYRYINDCSSKHVYYDYYIDVEEGQFFETGMKSAYKNKRYYYQLKDGNFNNVTAKEIMEFFNGKKIS